MSGLSNSLSILFLTIQWLGFVLPAPTVNNNDASDRLLSFEIQIDRQSDVLLPELEIQLLQAQKQQDDLAFELRRSWTH
ncbi:uncharacterized protein LOC108147119 isoform X3 [Drosophila elegans]|uniref:uncharacterized protein LOC108147119 isoform X3 n=1 Tax=Drosophila elegans TaxID=30023 RepID=UPI001BC86980|nr:uncharacterized protein LOC108147119 isoform X3 [Drosophila elegans]